MAKISQKAVDEYVKSGGRRCPFCKVGEVESKNGLFSTDNDPFVTQWVGCTNPKCGEEWDDVYVLGDINEDAYDD